MPNPITFSRRSIFFLPLALGACKWRNELFELTGRTMGTTYSVIATDRTRQLDETEIRVAIEAALAGVNQQMSNWDAGSEISRFNDGAGTAPVAISPALYEVMAAAQSVHDASDGRFDTTAGGLIELWGFGADGRGAMPSEAQIESAMANAGHSRTLRLGNGTLQKQEADTRVYLAAIGKGYGADQVGRALAGLGLQDFMVEIGGDLYTSGRNPDGMPWQIGIEMPSALSGGLYNAIGISGMGLASSGDYRNFYEEDGQRFTHVIDPTTGRPITHNTASATVIADTAMLADAWATGMLTLGRERGLEIAEEQGLAVLFIDRDGAGGFSSASSSRYDLLTA